MNFTKVDNIASELDLIPGMVEELVKGIEKRFHYFYLYRQCGVIVSESAFGPYKVDVAKMITFSPNQYSVEELMRYYKETGKLIIPLNT